MEPESVKPINKPEKENKPAPNNDDNKQSLEKSSPRLSRSSSSSSSSSSSLSIEFSIDENDLLSGPGSPKWSLQSASPPPETGAHLSPSNGYDPNRIPASIFSTKPSNPDGWSVASNESLFSIQMGNNSFSLDNPILYAKSGELKRLDESNGSPLPVYGNSGLPTVIEESGEVSRVQSFDSPKVISLSPNENRAEEKKGPGNIDGSTNEPELKKAPYHEASLKSLSMSRTSASNNRLSDESGNSCSSFAFPVLVNEGVKTGSSRKVTDTNPEPPQVSSSIQEVSNSTQQAIEQERWYSRFCCCWPRCC
ncbi:hypothetical protein CASFOL_032870 [Castilleja foliolosa]|uniref:Uncharacterized protein n=1 Tax=Castilleja foliolosa TaxID=1961234 RepID=A0ABD3C413_9LAMI